MTRDECTGCYGFASMPCACTCHDAEDMTREAASFEKLGWALTTELIGDACYDDGDVICGPGCPHDPTDHDAANEDRKVGLS